ncbi:MAG: HD domain-containing protein [bacterium]|nr:HD domain-containing protein [bacterium]
MALKQLNIGDRASGVFLLRSFQEKISRIGSSYWEFELVDKSGRMLCRWFQPTLPPPETTPLAVQAELVVEVWNERKVGKITSLEFLPNEKVDWNKLIPVSKRSKDELIADLISRVTQIQDVHYHRLWQELLQDKSWLERYAEAPAGKLWHHTYRSGLLEHSLCVADLCAVAAKNHPIADADLLLCGALLHDVGKIWELSSTPAADYTEMGRMLGHIFIGANFVSKKMEAISDFPLRHKIRLLHLILSHQGEHVKGSPIIPASIEAKILHYADELDAHTEAFEHIITNEADGEKLFTSYIPLANAFLYLGDRPDRLFKEDNSTQENENPDNKKD